MVNAHLEECICVLFVAYEILIDICVFPAACLLREIDVRIVQIYISDVVPFSCAFEECIISGFCLLFPFRLIPCLAVVADGIVIAGHHAVLNRCLDRCVRGPGNARAQSHDLSVKEEPGLLRFEIHILPQVCRIVVHSGCAVCPVGRSSYP